MTATPAVDAQTPTDLPGTIGPSLVRTVVPLIVALLARILLTKFGFDTSKYGDFLTNVVATAVATVYYAAVRYLETYVKPKFGWLLGLAKAPVYDATSVKDAASVSGEVAGPASDQAPQTPTVTVPADPTTGEPVPFTASLSDGTLAPPSDSDTEFGYHHPDTDPK